MIAYLASNPLLAAALLLGLSVAVATSLWLSIRRLSSVSLVAATKHPFAKYIVLSILAHVALAIWLYSFYFNLGSGHSRRTNPVTVRIASDSSETEQPENDKPWDAPSPRAIDAPLPGLAEEPVAPPPERTRPDPNLAEPGNSLLGQLNALPTDHEVGWQCIQLAQ